MSSRRAAPASRAGGRAQAAVQPAAASRPAPPSAIRGAGTVQPPTSGANRGSTPAAARGSVRVQEPPRGNRSAPAQRPATPATPTTPGRETPARETHAHACEIPNLLDRCRTRCLDWIRPSELESIRTPCFEVKYYRGTKFSCVLGWLLIWMFLVCYVIGGFYPYRYYNAIKKMATLDEMFPNGIDLYYGIQWWGLDNTLHPVINTTTGLGQGRSAYFDPRKPTVIYVHGWVPDAVTNRDLERLTSFTGVHMADLWIEQGWNVGMFYWTQFADEKNNLVAEAKIWDTCLPSGVCYPASPMHWRGHDGNYYAWKDGDAKSVGQIFYDSVVTSLANADNSSESAFSLRLVGHALGAELIIAAALKLAVAAESGAIPSVLKPDRIAMLDPFWSKSREASVFTSMSELTVNYDVALETTRASAMTCLNRYGAILKQRAEMGTTNYEMGALAVKNPAYTDPFRTTVLAPFSPAEIVKHEAAKATYFLSIDPRDPNALKGPSARTTNKVLKQFRDSGKYWKQVAGQSTETILDDKYLALSWATSPALSRTAYPGQWLNQLMVLLLVLFTFTGCMMCCAVFKLVSVLRRWLKPSEEDEAEVEELPPTRTSELLRTIDELRLPTHHYSFRITEGAAARASA